MEKKRVFVAIDISGEARDRVLRHIVNLRTLHANVRARWVAPENLHITMRFVGNVDAAGLRSLDERVHTVASKFTPFETTLAETGNFGRRRDRTDTLWIGVKAVDDILSNIAAALEDKPIRKFVPHLTIARIKDSSQARDLIDEHLSTTFNPISFATTDLVIYESTLTPNGSVYSVLSRYGLEFKL